MKLILCSLYKSNEKELNNITFELKGIELKWQNN